MTEKKVNPYAKKSQERKAEQEHKIETAKQNDNAEEMKTNEPVIEKKKHAGGRKPKYKNPTKVLTVRMDAELYDKFQEKNYGEMTSTIIAFVEEDVKRKRFNWFKNKQ